MRRDGYLGASCQKSDPPFAPATSISYKTDAFPLPNDVYGYIRCFCATTLHDVMTLTFHLLTLRVFHLHSCPTHIPILIVLPLSVTEFRLLNLITFTLFETVTAHAPCRVTYNRGEAKIIHIFEIPDHNLPIHFVTFRAKTKIKPCYRRQQRLSHCEGYNVYCACAVSRDLCIRVLPKPHVTIF